VAKRGFFIFIVFSGLFHLIATAQNDSSKSLLQTTLLIDSIENLLPTATPIEKVELYDTLARLSANLSAERSIHYYTELISIPDSVISFQRKMKTINKIAGLYMSTHQVDKANEYLSLYASEISRFPQETGKQFLHTLTKTDSNRTRKTFSITNYEILILLLLLIVVAILYLSGIYRKFKAIEQKKMRLQREIEIIKAKNLEVEAEFEKIIQDKTSEEEAKINEIRKTHIKLKKQLKKLEESIYNRYAFLSGLGPELRTALSSILGFTAELKSDISQQGNKELINNSIELFSKTAQLDIMLENIVDISSAQINVLNLAIHPTNINNVIEEVLEFFHSLFNSKKVKVQTKVASNLPDVLADKEKLTRLLKELVMNASRKTKTGDIQLAVSSNKSLSKIIIVVSDTGKGKTESRLQKLGNTKQQGGLLDDNHTLNTLVGLNAARELIAAMNGSMHISTLPEEGTTITLHLNAAQQSTAPAKEKEIPKRVNLEKDEAASDIDIFLVEDDQMNRMVIETMLKHTGRITTAVDGEQTLRIIEEYHKSGKEFDIMLFDINLPPPWDGIKLLHKIRKDYAEYQNIPFVAQTAYAMASDRDKFLNEGFDDYLTKPINKGELITIIHRQLELFKRQNNKPAE